ncbi:LexA-binding, inner membrane-associated putative hydrolase [Kitasatospora sp. SolWspMP-SS2h]|uniref:metal-dependent hydrolase n=1 Tax=Kitasatospora sp. SolWspMP-SS2h TaxID=1305729 RepID=UPI000DB97114|nr:metal-dependent hydrolase [Kitasatospora sp. SolWspMP-SS2h]RAJ45396.1 LexA-binding, inner membrane-associated putative hydrolase [Kitasatospora sp. SolWspMP-SS2h]
MMGPAHALSGAAAWVAVGAVAAVLDEPMPWPVLLVGALITAGAALAPDLDHRAATISRAFGPVSRWLCEVIDQLSAAVYRSTRGKGDARRSGGHRTLTHTWPWAVTCGAVAAAVTVYGGRWGVLAVLFVHMVLAVEGLLWRHARVSSDVLVWLLGLTSAWMLADILEEPGHGARWLFDGAGQQYLWIGLPIMLGALVHCVGDALTVSGCPVLWPIPIGRKRWYPVGPPKGMRFRAGSKVEVKVLSPIFMGLSAVGALVALRVIG